MIRPSSTQYVRTSPPTELRLFAIDLFFALLLPDQVSFKEQQTYVYRLRLCTDSFNSDDSDITMTLWKTAALVLALSSSTTTAFAPQRPQTRSTTALALTSEEILARSREAAGLPAVDSLPMVFDEDILSDFQAALLTLEKRVQKGPGSLEQTEIDTLTEQLDRIVDEMHQNADRRHQKPVRQAPETSAPPQVAAASAELPTPQESVAAATTLVDPENNDEGPAYDGRGGMGQPRGTVNTYIIEGMEDMTSDEYRLALQQSLIDKQRARRAAGKVGNTGSLDYLHSLSPSGNDMHKRDGSSDQDGSSKSWRGWN